MPEFTDLTPPVQGNPVTRDERGELVVPPDPIIPFIEGDGIGPDIWAATRKVLDATVAKTYSGDRRIEWFEVYAGEKANDRFGNWLPDDTLEAMRAYRVAIKGPLTTPVGGGFRSLNGAALMSF